MKRLTFIMLALLAIAGRVSAQESISVSEATVPQGGEAFVEVNYSLEGAGPYVGFMFLVDLPEGLTLVEGEEPGYPWYDEKVSAISKMSITTTATGFAATPKTKEATINGTSGVLMRFKVAADESLAIGTKLTATLKEVSFNVRDEEYNVSKVALDDVSFEITVVENLGYVLDESKAEEIVAGSYELVTLKRTFVKGWNTVCLPFDIDDVEAFFGEGAKAYDFVNYDVEEGTIDFEVVDELIASLPYVVYVPAEITEDITLTDIEIEEECTEADNTTINNKKLKKKYIFQGTYAPVAPGEWEKNEDTDVIYGVTPEGQIKKAGAEASIKGFRGYFDLPAGAAVKGFVFEDEATSIKSMNNVESEGAIYNVAGQRLSKTQKGINITNGKKILK